jgi:hypothetical protein
LRRKALKKVKDVKHDGPLKEVKLLLLAVAA